MINQVLQAVRLDSDGEPDRRRRRLVCPSQRAMISGVTLGEPPAATSLGAHESALGYWSGALPADSATLGRLNLQGASSTASRRTLNCQLSP